MANLVKSDLIAEGSNFHDSVIDRRSAREEKRSENDGPTYNFEQFPGRSSSRLDIDEKWPGEVSKYQIAESCR
jgi:hypothetical protein